MTAFDRITVGETFEFGSYEFTAERIKRFANAWDPQPFHVDEAAGAQSHFGGLVTSGWHTASVLMRRQVDYFAGHPSAPRFGPSPGFDDLKWLKPVCAGDRVAFSGRVAGKRHSRSRPGFGIVSMAFFGTNQNGQSVLSMTGHVFVAMA